MENKIKVLIADDHPIFRHGLAALIGADGEIDLVGEVENGKVALEIVEERQPDVIILDIDMPIMDGVETAQILRTRKVESKIVFLTMHKDISLLNSLESLQVNGYVVKDSAMTEIVHCIKKVFAGSTYLSSILNDLTAENLEKDSANFEMLSVLSSLTQTEKQVLSLISESKTNHEIADELFINIITVQSHRHSIGSKLKINDTHTLLKFAIKNRDKIIASASI